MISEFQGSHYHLIRTNPEYRNRCMMEELIAERQPSWCQYIPFLKEQGVAVPPPEPEGDILYKRVDNLQARINYLTDKVNQLTIAKKKKLWTNDLTPTNLENLETQI